MILALPTGQGSSCAEWRPSPERTRGEPTPPSKHRREPAVKTEIEARLRQEQRDEDKEIDDCGESF